MSDPLSRVIVGLYAVAMIAALVGWFNEWRLARRTLRQAERHRTATTPRRHLHRRRRRTRRCHHRRYYVP